MKDVTDELQAPFNTSGSRKPIVVMAIDWTALSNGGHYSGEQNSRGRGHYSGRVAIHCVHQHNAPFACLEAAIVEAQGDLPHIVRLDYFHDCIDRISRAAKGVSLTLVGLARREGEARVEKVASNRRIYRGKWRHQSDAAVVTRPKLRAMTEGMIDPM